MESSKTGVVRFLDLHRQYLSIQGEIDAAIASVIRDTAFIKGSYVTSFENDFARYQAAGHAIGVGNGTDGLEIALEALALPSGCEVIVPANSFVASSEAVTRAGHRVVFCDVDPRTYSLDPNDLARRITGSTRAVIVVHLYGKPVDMDAVLAIAKEHGLKVIEDAAQAHGAEYKGRRVGAIGDIGVFSFYPGKNLGGYGDGGAIVTNEPSLAHECRRIADHGRVSKYDHVREGRNSRLDGIQAAVLSCKLRHLDGWNERRRAIARQYFDGLGELDDVRLPLIEPWAQSSFHLYVIQTAKRDALRACLSEQGVETGIHYPLALPKLAAYQYLGQADAELNANRMDRELLSLPIGEHMSDEDCRRVVSAVRRFFGGA